MTALDLFFDYIVTDDLDIISNETYDAYSIMPDNKYILMTIKSYVDDKECKIDTLTGVEDICFTGKDDSFYIDYESIKYLMDISVEGTIPTEEPSQRNQLIAIRGTCDHECSKCIEKYNGYALREIPSCNKDLVGTTIWTSKWATLADFMLDVIMWVKQCKGLDVLIINFNGTPHVYEPELDFKYIPICVLIKGSHIKFLSDKKEIEKLYKKYATTYECTDYIIEDSISYPEEGFYFEFDKPKGV